MSIDPRLISPPIVHPKGTASRMGDLQRKISNLEAKAGTVPPGIYPTLAGSARTQLIGMPTKAALSVNQAVASGTVKVSLDTTVISGVDFDPYQGWDTLVSFNYVVPDTGFFQISASIGVVTTTALQTAIQAQIFNQTNNVLNGSMPSIAVNAASMASSVSGLIHCNALETIDLRVFCNQNITVVGSATLADTFLSIMQVA